jgi:ATP-dependent Zn protease
VKQSAGALFDMMWGAHGREAVRERFDQAREQVKVIIYVWLVACGYV